VTGGVQARNDGILSYRRRASGEFRFPPDLFASEDHERASYCYGCWLVYCVAASDPNDIYGFLVDPDEGWYQIWKLEDDRFETILAEGDSSVIGFGTDPSYIRGECSSRSGGTDLWMYVNGHVVASVRDQDGFGRFHGVGVLARAIDGSMDARFDNVFYARIRR